MLSETCWNYSGCIGIFDEDFYDILSRSSLASSLESLFDQRDFDRIENFIPDFKQTTKIVPGSTQTKKVVPESTKIADERILFGDCSRKRPRSVYESDYENHSDFDYDIEEIKSMFP